MNTKIQSALLSVYNKENLLPLVEFLHQKQVKLYSTGGTEQFIKDAGFPVERVEDLTGYPSILGGRVKTLHPKVFGGILARRDHELDKEQMRSMQIPAFDLVVVDLYPFVETVESGGTHQEIIEKIDIGGISLIRAAAKNFQDVLIVSSRADYTPVLHHLKKFNGECTLEFRHHMAIASFERTAEYDVAIGEWMGGNHPLRELRYGENPHQKGHFKGDLGQVFEQIQGKDLSYNNLLDADAAVHLIADISEPAVAILKHNNACGLAIDSNPQAAWKKALESDPVSAFGGIIICNHKVQGALAREINKIFFEILIAPAYDQEALTLLTAKKNRIILRQKNTGFPERSERSCLNGTLLQDKDNALAQRDQCKVVTQKAPDEREWTDLLLAEVLVKHTKSNAIVLVKDGRLLASGTGQTSRVDALQQALDKAKKFKLSTKGAVMASDAFFPFPDCVKIGAEAGISAILQPGGSIKDQDSIDACNKKNISMIFTGIRHFRH